jgi:hypothetical protein
MGLQVGSQPLTFTGLALYSTYFSWYKVPAGDRVSPKVYGILPMGRKKPEKGSLQYQEAAVPPTVTVARNRRAGLRIPLCFLNHRSSFIEMIGKVDSKGKDAPWC